MESTLSATISKTLNPYFISRLRCNFSTTGSIEQSLRSRRIFNSDLHSLNNFTLMAVAPVRSRLQCVSSSDASFASRGGGDCSVDVSDSSSDVIILDVRGMICGGCVASVKRILESQPQISSANVDLTTETAVVWPISEAKVVSNWQKNLGVELAKHLTSCGFESNLRGDGSTAGDISL